MIYTPITDEEGVKDAFLRLQALFHENAEGNKEFPRHSQWDLRGELREAPGDGYNRYIMQFGFGDGPKFMANVRPKSRDQESSIGVRGLFVKDERGHRFLTHNGRFDKPPRSSEKFRQFLDSRYWIDVKEDPESRFLIAKIDDISASDLADQICKIARIIEDFKTDPVAPIIPHGNHMENPTMQNRSKGLNTILCGPPGTGKTFSTASRCVEICDGALDEEKSPKEIRCRYNELLEVGQVEFITFHQSYSYEEFVEGLRPDTKRTDDGEKQNAGFRLVPTPGVLTRIAKRARKASRSTQSFVLTGRQVFKMGLGNPERGKEYDEIFDQSVEKGYVLLGKGRMENWSDPAFDNDSKIAQYHRANPDAGLSNSDVSMIKCFRNKMQVDDIVIVSAKQNRFRAVGVVKGGYEFSKDSEYQHRRAVQWLWYDKGGRPFSEIYPKKMPQPAICKLVRSLIDDEKLLDYFCSTSTQQYVLVIDSEFNP